MWPTYRRAINIWWKLRSFKIRIIRYLQRTGIKRFIKLCFRFLFYAPIRFWYFSWALTYIGWNRVFSSKKLIAAVEAFKHFVLLCASDDERVLSIDFRRAVESLVIRDSYRFAKPADVCSRLSSICTKKRSITKELLGKREEGRLRVLYVCAMFPSVMHAGGLRLFDLLSEQSKRHEVDLYTIFSGSQDERSLEILRNRLGSIRVVHPNMFSANDITGWLFERGLRFGHYDVIHFEYPESAYLLNDLRMWGRKNIYTMQECVTKRAFMPISERLFGKIPLRLLRNLLDMARSEKIGVENCDLCIAVTADDANFAKRVFSISPTVIPTGISDFAVLEPLKYLKQVNQSGDPTALFLGYYGHSPNLEGLAWYLEHVHHFVRDRIPAYKFKIVGRGDLSILRDRYGSDPTIEFIGEVEDFVPVIAQSRICLAPLISGAGFRGKVNQYAALGKPVVSTSIGADGLPYENGKSILIEDDPIQFARAVVSLLTDGELAQSIGKAAETIAKNKFTWQAIAPHLEAKYET